MGCMCRGRMCRPRRSNANRKPGRQGSSRPRACTFRLAGSSLRRRRSGSACPWTAGMDRTGRGRSRRRRRSRRVRMLDRTGSSPHPCRVPLQRNSCRRRRDSNRSRRLRSRHSRCRSRRPGSRSRDVGRRKRTAACANCRPRSLGRCKDWSMGHRRHWCRRRRFHSPRSSSRRRQIGVDSCARTRFPASGWRRLPRSSRRSPSTPLVACRAARSRGRTRQNACHPLCLCPFRGIKRTNR